MKFRYVTRHVFAKDKRSLLPLAFLVSNGNSKKMSCGMSSRPLALVWVADEGVETMALTGIVSVMNDAMSSIVLGLLVKSTTQSMSRMVLEVAKISSGSGGNVVSL